MLRLRTSISLAVLTCAMLPAQRPGGDRGGDEPKDRKREAIKPYAEVITEAAKSDDGLFTVHFVDDKVFYEIPRETLGKEMLWVTQIARTQAGYGYGGTSVGNRVVRWTLRDEDILLRDVKYRIRADGGSVANSVEATSMEPIIATFPVKAWDADGAKTAAVIDVTDLFKGDKPEFSAKRRLNSSGADPKRSFIDQVRSFSGNIEAKVTMTYKPSAGGNQAGGRGRGRGRGQRRDPSQSGITVQLHHSMVKLPENPMQPRRHDERVGFFSVSFEDFASDEHQVEQVRYITRWRLEKQDPSAEVSEPKKPIVYYVGRGVPDRWRPWVKKGIEMWQPAFENAGFKNAILAKDAPSREAAPDWDAEDARHSVIRWMPSTTENAMGPHVHDPRTGEILEADIIMYHNVIKLCRDWYFVQASPSDPRAQQLPMPDDLMGELLAYVVAHEVGHTLGFPHNMKASNSFSVAQLRDAAFTEKHGTEASIMDYGRFNYVAQPGDGARLIPKIGPYDFFAVEWGYRPFANATTPEAEKPHLEALAARQKSDPMLRFGGGNASEDPTQQTEDLSTDAIEATRLGLKNLERVMSYLVKATCKPGQDYSLLQNMYNQVISQRNREIGHVANVVGGVAKQNLWYGDADRTYYPEAAKRQRDAVKFLDEHAFKTPRELIDPDVLGRIEASGHADRILSGQRRVLSTLINDRRVKRMAELEALDPPSAYTPHEMLQDVSDAVWRELSGDDVAKIELYRRNLQRAHVEILGEQIGNADASTDLPALSRGQLQGISNLINASYSKVSDPTTQQHLDDIEARIREALKPKEQPATLDRTQGPGRRRVN